ncbi:MAG TPA: immunoglobulin-like domain-containing protein [Cellulomonas sp.]
MSRRPLAVRSPLALLVAGALAASAAVSGALVAGPAAAATLPDSLIDTASTTWSYSDDDTDPSAGSDDRLSWTTTSFDDASWKTGLGAFGAKNGKATGLGDSFPVTTLLSQYISGTSTDVPTFHFRTEITLDSEQLAAIGELEATITYDDAVQVFVNGVKVAGYVDDKVEAATSSQNLMYAGNSGGDPVTSTFTISASALVEGENTIAVALYQDRTTSSDIYFDFESLVPVDASTGDSHDDIVQTVGSDESSRSITWYTDADTVQQVQYGVATDSGDLPTSGVTTVAATGAKTTSGEYDRSATITGLSESTLYAYRVGSDEGGWSEVHTIRTQSFSGDYSFLFFGDPQIGASGSTTSDGEGWADTLDVALETYPDTELLFSAGDQVDSAADEAEYDAFLEPSALSDLALVPMIGNHDVGSKAYEQHYTVPNLDSTAGAATSTTSSGGDYWFIYKDVLFVVLNSNSSDYASHIEFMNEVVAEHGDEASWKVLAFHHSIYSVAKHVSDSDIQGLRDALPTTISDLGFDLVLQGHDHAYTRSYLVKDGELADATEVAGQSEVSAAEGEVLYITANSSSGSKYYDVTMPEAWYASVINQEKVRNYSNIEVTADSITITTLRSEANGSDEPVNSVVDEVTLVRDDVTAPELTVPASGDVTLGSTFDALTGVTATDAVDGDLTSAVQVTGAVDTATVGSYELTYSVTDAAGNVATATRTVTVVEAPVLTLSASTVAQGSTLTVTGTGFADGEELTAEVHSDPVSLGAFTATDGAVSISWTVPSTFEAGEHTLVVTRADGTTVEAAFTVTATTSEVSAAGTSSTAGTSGTTSASTASGSTSSVLATTGGVLSVAAIVLAVLLLTAGSLLVARSRLRRQA